MSTNELKSSHSSIMFTKHMKICNETYILTHKIGSGNFGEVFLGVQSTTKNNKSSKMVAIKVQKQIPSKSAQLINEVDILKELQSDPNSVGFPQVYEHGFEKGNHFMIMELLGPNLSDLMKMCGGRFTLGTTIVLAMQIFERLEYVHSHGYVYRDIKPENFTMGTGKKSAVLYMLDFGLSKRYRDPRVNLHMPYREEQDFSGTLRYASICSHLRIEHSRRDDLESVCYMLIYFLQGTLPWQNNNRLDTIDLKERLIIQKKIKTTPAQLCANVPTEFRNILQYCLDLDYYEEPDYQMISGELMQLYEKVLGGKEFVYDWALQTTEKTVTKEEMTLKISPHETARNQNDNVDFEKYDDENEDDEEEWLGEDDDEEGEQGQEGSGSDGESNMSDRSIN